MSSLRENVISAAAAALVTANVAGGRVYRSRWHALPELPGVTVTPLGESADEAPLGMLDRTLSLAVTVHASGSPADGAADATLAEVEAAMFADRTLGLGSDVQIKSAMETRWDFDDADVVRVAAIFSISMRTAL